MIERVILTVAVFTQLKAALIHGKARYPEGHGKIERFHQTAIRRVLRNFDRAVDVDPAPQALELRLMHYLTRYNDTPHESLGQATPRMRFDSDSRALRFPEHEAALRAAFIETPRRCTRATRTSAHHRTCLRALGALSREVMRSDSHAMISPSTSHLNGYGNSSGLCVDPKH